MSEKRSAKPKDRRPTDPEARAPGQQCPRCGRMKVYRSRRRGLLEQMASIINRRYPMRCHACNYRFSLRIDPRRRKRGA